MNTRKHLTLDEKTTACGRTLRQGVQRTRHAVRTNCDECRAKVAQAAAQEAK